VATASASSRRCASCGSDSARRSSRPRIGSTQGLPRASFHERGGAMVEGATNEDRMTIADLRNLWRILSPDERLGGWKLLEHDDAEEFFLAVGPADPARLVLEMPKDERCSGTRILP